jgi:hypothetical protein
MSAKIFTPIQSVEDFEAAYNRFLPLMDAESAFKALTALNTLKNRGMPNPDEYSLTSITASDEEDLNVKIHLALLPPQLAMINEEISQDEMMTDITPLMEEIISCAFDDIKWPLTISVAQAL